MASVDMSVTLQSPASKVWALIGGFDALPRWLPPIASSEGVGHGQAKRRRLTLQGGGEVLEELVHHDNDARSYSYTIVSSPLPVAGYRAELGVSEAGPQSCTVRWRSTFEVEGAAEAEGVAAIRGVYQAGFDSLKRQFG